MGMTTLASLEVSTQLCKSEVGKKTYKNEISAIYCTGLLSLKIKTFIPLDENLYHNDPGTPVWHELLAKPHYHL